MKGILGDTRETSRKEFREVREILVPRKMEVKTEKFLQYLNFKTCKCMVLPQVGLRYLCLRGHETREDLEWYI